MTLSLTPRAAAFPISREGIALEAYLDPANVWTVFGGIATTSGYNVLQYKGRPATLGIAVRETVTFMRARYLPAVDKAFGGKPLAENQIAAALSFNWNEGAILTADWVKLYLAGKIAAARQSLLTQWTNGGLLSGRREVEAALFFDATWPSLLCPVRQVLHPSFKPGGTTPTDIMPVLQQILGGS